MEWDRLPGLRRITKRVRTLSDTPLEGSAFHAACTCFGWHCDTDSSTAQDYMAFKVSANGRLLHVTLTEGKVNLAVLPLLFWEDWDQEFFEGSEALYRRARAPFDRNYSRALQQVEKVLGAPLRVWTEDSEDRFQKAVWQGKTCLLVLQQDDYDLQFGFDINFLLQPHQGPLPERLELKV